MEHFHRSGPEAIARAISAAAIPDQFGNTWQYHPQSDRHSKIACWVIAADLIDRCELLRDHIDSGKVVVGVHYKLKDFQTQRSKVLDLVIARPAAKINLPTVRTFAELATELGIELPGPSRARYERLLITPHADIGSVLVALEAKAAMTAHVKALPRLHDELDSSHQTTHGNSESALAVGFVMVNAAETFISPGLNKVDLSGTPVQINTHSQPHAAQRVIDKISEIRRRSGGAGAGFDAMGVMVVEAKNDGSEIRVVAEPDAKFTYDEMIDRVSHEYSSRFARL